MNELKIHLEEINISIDLKGIQERKLTRERLNKTDLSTGLSSSNEQVSQIMNFVLDKQRKNFKRMSQP